ncbi:MAG TPA: hypothetical protein VFW33_01145 [Gemmataceae bacterium]|nr:hypothetical protein [Gemmataceae bacterium]
MSTSHAGPRAIPTLVGALLVLALAGGPSLCWAQAPAPVPEPPGGAAPAPDTALRGPFGSPSPAWFAGVEVGLFHVVNPVGTFVTRENVKMDDTAELRGELGYRFEDGSALRVGYRTLSTGGTGTVLFPDNGAAAPRLHFEVNSVDVDYLSGVVPGLFHDRVSFEVGLRVASKLLESRGSDPYEGYSFHGLFVGAGPHFGLTSTLPIGESGLALFSRYDLALVFGEERDRSATAYLASPDPSAGYKDSRWEMATVGDATAQFGVSWAGTLGSRFWARAALGVQLEYVGFGGQQLFEFSNDRVHPLDGLFSAGPFFRFEIAY